MKPTAAKPKIIMAQVEASGTEGIDVSGIGRMISFQGAGLLLSLGRISLEEGLPAPPLPPPPPMPPALPTCGVIFQEPAGQLCEAPLEAEYLRQRGASSSQVRACSNSDAPNSVAPRCTPSLPRSSGERLCKEKSFAHLSAQAGAAIAPEKKRRCEISRRYPSRPSGCRNVGTGSGPGHRLSASANNQQTQESAISTEWARTESECRSCTMRQSTRWLLYSSRTEACVPPTIRRPLSIIETRRHRIPISPL